MTKIRYIRPTSWYSTTLFILKVKDAFQSIMQLKNLFSYPKLVFTISFSQHTFMQSNTPQIVNRLIFILLLKQNTLK